MKCIDCKNDCIIDYNKKINLKGENYYLAICQSCGKRHFVKDESIQEITWKFEVK